MSSEKRESRGANAETPVNENYNNSLPDESTIVESVPSIIFFGMTGTGKTSLYNLIANESAEVSGSSSSCTKIPNWAMTAINLNLHGEIVEIAFKIIDTVGFGDAVMDDAQIMADATAAAVSSVPKGVLAFIYVYDMRFQKYQAAQVELYEEYFGEDFYKNLLVLKHKSDIDSLFLSKKKQRQYRNQIEGELKKVLDKGAELEFTCTPTAERDDEMEDIEYNMLVKRTQKYLRYSHTRICEYLAKKRHDPYVTNAQWLKTAKQDYEKIKMARDEKEKARLEEIQRKNLERALVLINKKWHAKWDIVLKGCGIVIGAAVGVGTGSIVPAFISGAVASFGGYCISAFTHTTTSTTTRTSK